MRGADLRATLEEQEKNHAAVRAWRAEQQLAEEDEKTQLESIQIQFTRHNYMIYKLLEYNYIFNQSLSMFRNVRALLKPCASTADA